MFPSFKWHSSKKAETFIIHRSYWLYETKSIVRGVTDTETGMLPGIPRSAICVQRFDDSLCSAIRITYRISLRSSSLQEPRYPLLKVVLISCYDFYFSSASVTIVKDGRQRGNKKGSDKHSWIMFVRIKMLMTVFHLIWWANTCNSVYHQSLTAEG